MIRDLRDVAWLDAPDLTANAESVHQELARALTAAGLYSKEATAMIATWRDSWFEEGMRIFYLVPRHTVDEVLPLRIAPTPAAIERVFVGRVEVLSPSIQVTIETALESGDTETLGKYGRFLRPFCARILTKRGHLGISPQAADFLAHGDRPATQTEASPCAVEPSVPAGERQ